MNKKEYLIRRILRNYIAEGNIKRDFNSSCTDGSRSICIYSDLILHYWQISSEIIHAQLLIKSTNQFPLEENVTSYLNTLIPNLNTEFKDGLLIVKRNNKTDPVDTVREISTQLRDIIENSGILKRYETFSIYPQELITPPSLRHIGLDELQEYCLKYPWSLNSDHIQRFGYNIDHHLNNTGVQKVFDNYQHYFNIWKNLVEIKNTLNSQREVINAGIFSATINDQINTTDANFLGSLLRQERGVGKDHSYNQEIKDLIFKETVEADNGFLLQFITYAVLDNPKIPRGYYGRFRSEFRGFVDRNFKRKYLDKIKTLSSSGERLDSAHRRFIELVSKEPEFKEDINQIIINSLNKDPFFLGYIDDYLQKNLTPEIETVLIQSLKQYRNRLEETLLKGLEGNYNHDFHGETNTPLRLEKHPYLVLSRNLSDIDGVIRRFNNALKIIDPTEPPIESLIFSDKEKFKDIKTSPELIHFEVATTLEELGLTLKAPVTNEVFHSNHLLYPNLVFSILLDLYFDRRLDQEDLDHILAIDKIFKPREVIPQKIRQMDTVLARILPN